MKVPTAIITGASGQDGWYLTKLLLSKGYAVHALTREVDRIDDAHDQAIYHSGDVADFRFVEGLLHQVQPTEIYNLAAMSRPAVSWEQWQDAAQINAIAPHALCELIRHVVPKARLFHASSSDIFGPNASAVQNESTPCVPDSPYGAAKEYAHRIIGAYRKRYGLHFSAGILFNHESPRRPLSFVSQKIAHGVALISLGRTNSKELDENGRPILTDGKLNLGNINAKRDFGFAGDYVEAMQAILQHRIADDFAIGTGVSHSIAQFCEVAFRTVGLEWRDHVVSRPDLVRVADQDSCADPSKLQSEIGWRAKTSFADLVKILVKARVELLQGRAV